MLKANGIKEAFEEKWPRVSGHSIIIAADFKERGTSRLSRSYICQGGNELDKKDDGKHVYVWQLGQDRKAGPCNSTPLYVNFVSNVKVILPTVPFSCLSLGTDKIHNAADFNFTSDVFEDYMKSSPK
jgi:hypothetical protein